MYNIKQVIFQKYKTELSLDVSRRLDHAPPLTKRQSTGLIKQKVSWAKF